MKIKYRNDAHRIAVESRDRAYANFCSLRGDGAFGFRASIPKLTAAQVALTRAEDHLDDVILAARAEAAARAG